LTVSSQTPIPIPWSHRFRLVRYRVVPILVFVVAAGSAGLLWRHQAGVLRAIGEVEVVRYELTAPADGILVTLPGPQRQLCDRLLAGEVAARLDDRVSAAELDMVRGEIARLQKELEATSVRTRLEVAAAEAGASAYAVRKLDEVRQLAVDVERLRLDLLDRQAQTQSDRVELQRLNERLEATRKVFAQGAETPYMMMDVQLRRDMTAERLAGGLKAVQEAQEQLKTVAARRDSALGEIPSLPACPSADSLVTAFLAPLQAAVAVQEARLRQVQTQIEQLTIRAPADARICEIYRRPGQAVRLGDPILAIAVERSRNVISYFREQQAPRPQVGMEAEIRLRTVPRRILRGTVEQVGPQIAEVPPHQLVNPRVLEWGLPVRIGLPQDADLCPGELVDIVFKAPPQTPGPSPAD